MTHRFYVRPSDGREITGVDTLEAAEALSRDYGDGTHVIDTHAQTYYPMLQESRDGALVYAGFGGWDTGRRGIDQDYIEAIKKGHVALVHAFLAKGADVNACDPSGGTALHWAVGGGKPDVVALLLAHGADKSAVDHHGQTPPKLAEKLAEKKGNAEILVLLIDD